MNLNWLHSRRIESDVDKHQISKINLLQPHFLCILQQYQEFQGQRTNESKWNKMINKKEFITIRSRSMRLHQKININQIKGVTGNIILFICFVGGLFPNRKTFRDYLQISLLILSEFKWIN